MSHLTTFTFNLWSYFSIHITSKFPNSLLFTILSFAAQQKPARLPSTNFLKYHL